MPIVAFTLLAAMWVLSPWGGLMREERMVEFGVLVCEFARARIRRWEAG